MTEIEIDGVIYRQQRELQQDVKPGMEREVFEKMESFLRSEKPDALLLEAEPRGSEQATELVSELQTPLDRDDPQEEPSTRKRRPSTENLLEP